MKFRKIHLAAAAVFLICGLSGSCREEVLLPDLEGDLVGYVYTFDEFANPMEDHGDVLVSAYGVGRVYQTHTDVNGRFEYKNLRSGTYELHLEKPGFGTLKQLGIQHLGGEPTILGLNFNGTYHTAFFLYQMSTAQIAYLTVEADTISGVFDFTGEQPEGLYLLMYLSNEPDFNRQEAKYVIYQYLRYSNGRYQNALQYWQFPFETGEEIYCRACVITLRGSISDFGNQRVYGVDTYFDYDSYLTVYPNAGDESDQFSFIYPE
jgi:hypothetical protein